MDACTVTADGVVWDAPVVAGVPGFCTKPPEDGAAF